MNSPLRYIIPDSIIGDFVDKDFRSLCAMLSIPANMTLLEIEGNFIFARTDEPLWEIHAYDPLEHQELVLEGNFSSAKIIEIKDNNARQ